MKRPIVYDRPLYERFRAANSYLSLTPNAKYNIVLYFRGIGTIATLDFTKGKLVTCSCAGKGKKGRLFGQSLGGAIRFVRAEHASHPDFTEGPYEEKIGKILA